MWKVLSSEEIPINDHLVIIKEKLILPNSKTIEWIRYKDLGDVAIILAQNSQKEFLLLKEYNYPQQEYLIDAPGGFVPAGEDLQLGANRELREEAGYKAGRLHEIGSYYYDRRRSLGLSHVFLATELVEEKLNHDDSEDITIFWANEEEVDTLIRSGQVLSPRLLSAWTYFKLSK